LRRVAEAVGADADEAVVAVLRLEALQERSTAMRRLLRKLAARKFLADVADAGVGVVADVVAAAQQTAQSAKRISQLLKSMLMTHHVGADAGAGVVVVVVAAAAAQPSPLLPKARQCIMPSTRKVPRAVAVGADAAEVVAAGEDVLVAQGVAATRPLHERLESVARSRKL